MQQQLEGVYVTFTFIYGPKPQLESVTYTDELGEPRNDVSYAGMLDSSSLAGLFIQWTSAHPVRKWSQIHRKMSDVCQAVLKMATLFTFAVEDGQGVVHTMQTAPGDFYPLRTVFEEGARWQYIHKLEEVGK